MNLVHLRTSDLGQNRTANSNLGTSFIDIFNTSTVTCYKSEVKFNLMKKLSLYIFLFLLCFNFLNKANAIPKKGNGQGDLALSEDIIKEFHSYIVTLVNNNPLNFFITADHKNVFIEIRKNTTYRGVSGSGPIVRNKKKCEQKFKQECFLFANQRVIVWNNSINPIDSKKSKIKRKTSYDELIIKLSELGLLKQKNKKQQKKRNLLKKMQQKKN